MTLDINQLQHELNTQDNLFTEDPIYIVYEWEQIYSEQEGEEYEWRDEDHDLIDDKEIKKLTDKEIEEKGYSKCYYKEVRRFISAFLTMKSAEQFIKQNSYHWRKPHVYVETLWRNEEMKGIREYFMKCQAKEKKK